MRMDLGMRSTSHYDSMPCMTVASLEMSDEPIILGYLLAVNITSFLLYGIDKYKAKKGRWRISEATLLTMAAIGGSIGAWAGMRLWHDKTMLKKFKYGIPVIIIMQIALVVYLHTNL